MIKYLAPRWKVTILLTYLFLLAGLMSAGGGDTVGFDLSNSATILVLKIAQALSVILLFILPALAFSLFFTKEKIGYTQLNVKPQLLFLLFATGVFITAMPAISWMEQVNQKMSLPAFMSGVEAWMKASEGVLQKVTEAFLADISVGGLILNLVVIAFMAALSEELFFRGVLQKSLIEATGNIHAAVWITGILFSAFHMQFYGFIPRMFMGVALGYLFVWSGSLWVSIFAHFINNGVAVVLAWLVNRGTISESFAAITTPSNSDVQGGYDEVGWSLAFISFVLSGALLFLVYRGRKKPYENTHTKRENV